MTDILELPVEKYIPVAARVQKRLHALGIKTVRDLLYHFPHRYEDYSAVRPIADLKKSDVATIQGVLEKIDSRFAWGKRPHSAEASRGRRMTIVEARIKDDTGSIRAVWFNQHYLAKTLKPGIFVSLSGKIGLGKEGLYMQHPEHEVIDKRHETPHHSKLYTGQASDMRQEKIENPVIGNQLQAISYKPQATLRHTGRLVPIYHQTYGMTSRWLRFLVQQALTKLPSKLPDIVPAEIRAQYALPDFLNSLHEIHFPRTESEAEHAKQRFRFEELFLLQLKKYSAIRELKQKQAPIIESDASYQKELILKLPFALTRAQTKVFDDICDDLKKPHPMNRLLNGDVGSGKTIVALLSAFSAIKSGFQVAFMAPTEILTRQHFETFQKFFGDMGIAVGLATSSEKKIATPFGNSDKADVAKLARNGDLDLVFGTHALIQSAMTFKNLGLVIIDEQHRFGVKQRAALVRQETRDKRQDYSKNSMSHVADSTSLLPHLLSMTATPIPRTLALTVYGDLDISVLDELPQGRKKVITKIVRAARRGAAYQFIEEEMKKGRQVFVICPRIEESETTEEHAHHSFAALLAEEMKNVKKEFKKLSEDVFPHRAIAILHGKMKPKEKEKIMRAFTNGIYDMLVATSVIEVGVDIPNTTIMMIESAEKFGLAALHQFRGRVGRGQHQSYCLLFPTSESHEENERLKAVALSQNGFLLAEKDLKLRGPGNLAGFEQSGFHVPLQESLMDAALVEKTSKAARHIIDKDPECKKYPLLSKRLDALTYTLHAE